MTTLKRDEKTPARQALQTFLAFVLLFLLYAIAVQVTEIDLEKMRSENRQTQLVGVLRFLADPDITNPDIIDPLFVPESESFSLTETTVNTLNLIMETIFMALLATTIGTILAVPVSFLAARNLMLEVTSPLASFMLALALLPVGGGLAWLGAREMVALAATFSAQPALTLGIFVATLALGWAVVRFGPPLVTTTRRDSRGTAVAIAELVFLVLLALFALAQLAALSQVSGLWLADQLDAAAFNVGLFSINFSFVGNFFKVMGDLISLALPAVTALLGKGDSIYQDRLNHASLIDAGVLSRAAFKRYPHADMQLLQRQLEGRSRGEAMVVSDGVFSMDGDLAPLTSMAALCRRHQSWLMVDDAHGIGVLGESGAGTLEHLNLSAEDVPILMGTLGKALGTFGAFVAGSEELIETLIQRARSYVYTTALPPAVAEATRASLRLVIDERWRRERLQQLIRRFRLAVGQLGLPLMDSRTPIQPLLAGTSEQALAWSGELEQQGILVSAIRPPTVPEGGARLRVTLSAAHSDAQLDRLLDALASLKIGPLP